MITRLDDLSLAWFRRALCFSWGWTLIVKCFDLKAHYSDDGVLPRLLLDGLPWKFSVNMFSGRVEFQAMIFALSMLAAILCCLNYRPALTALVLWLTAISILSRNELVLNGADHYFATLLLWNIFLSCKKFRAAAGVGYVLQIAALYLFTGLCKIHFTPWLDGSAMRDVLGLDILTRPWSQSLRSSSALMSSMTYFTVAVELLAPVGLIVGLRFIRVRTFTLTLLAFVHLGIIALLKLYFIPVASLISLIPLIPAACWNREAHPSSIKRDWRSAIVALYLTTILLTNIFYLPSRPLTLTAGILNALRAFRLEQDWAFYAPPPTPGYDGWWVTEGTTDQGARIDVWNKIESAPAITKPVMLSNYYPNQHWTAYFINGADPSVRPLVQGLLPYLCREWSADPMHPPLKEIKLHRYTSINEEQPILQFTLSQDCLKL